MIARILVAASVIALAICGVAGATQTQAPSHASGRPLGIVHAIPSGSSLDPSPGPQGSGPSIVDNLTYNGPEQSGHGPVMHTNKVYTIFWIPPGYSVPSNYQSLINQFFQDVATDSGKTTNVYSSDVQYSDTHGFIQYKSTFGGTAVDTHAFPAGNCTTPSAVQGTQICMSDGQLRTEIARFAGSKGWTRGASTEFFLYTAHNVETCYLSDAQAQNDPYDQICSYASPGGGSGYCGYHDSFDATNGHYIYANMPYPNQTDNGRASACVATSTGQGLPNSGGAGAGTDGAAADEVINVSSHEHNEAITDPTGDGWWVDNAASVYAGQENGDLCAWHFPVNAVLGGSGTSSYNQVINGHHYSVQGEWSNATAGANGYTGCVWAFDARPTDSTLPTITGTAKVGSTLTAHAGTWSNSPTSYRWTWQQCNTSGFSCSAITTLTTSTATTTLQLGSAVAGHTIRVIVQASNARGTSTQARSNPTATVVDVPANSAAPTITGTAQNGQVITAHAGTWTNSPTSYKYQWFICPSNGSACTTTVRTHTGSGSTDTLTLNSGDVGHFMEVRVTAINAAGSSAPVTSAKTGKVTN